MFTFVFSFLVFVSIVAHIFIWNVLFAKLSKATHKDRLDFPSVTVVIATRNGVNDLKVILEDVLKQEYPEFSVMILDDASSDGTLDFMKEQNFPEVQYFRSEEHLGKKLILKKYLKEAKGDYLLFTDVDCKIQSINWIRRMIATSENHEVVLGYSPFTKSKGFANSLARFDNLLIALQYLSLAEMGSAYMAVGRNLLVKKSHRLEHTSKLDYSTLSGDDDLFIQSLPNRKSVTSCIHIEARVTSSAKATLKAFWKQKRRHITSSAQYDLKSKSTLTFIFLSQLLQYALILLALMHTMYLIGILLILFRWILMAVSFSRHAADLDIRGLTVKIFYLDVFHMIFTMILAVANFIKPSKTWS